MNRCHTFEIIDLFYSDVIPELMNHRMALKLKLNDTVSKTLSVNNKQTFIDFTIYSMEPHLNYNLEKVK